MKTWKDKLYYNELYKRRKVSPISESRGKSGVNKNRWKVGNFGEYSG
jgi:hypothetical protein